MPSSSSRKAARPALRSVPTGEAAGGPGGAAQAGPAKAGQAAPAGRKAAPRGAAKAPAKAAPAKAAPKGAQAAPGGAAKAAPAARRGGKAAPKGAAKDSPPIVVPSWPKPPAKATKPARAPFPPPETAEEKERKARALEISAKARATQRLAESSGQRQTCEDCREEKPITSFPTTSRLKSTGEMGRGKICRHCRDETRKQARGGAKK